MLVVGGCSFSSDFNVTEGTNYPALIASRLNVQYLDHARIQGSNWRIWRNITNHVLDGDITPDDTLFIQYTEVHRQEFWVPVAARYRDTKIHEPYDGGRLFKFKFGSHMYGEGIERALSKIMMTCNSQAYELDRFRVQHNLFCSFLMHRGFKQVYFINTRYSALGQPVPHDFDYPIIDCEHILKQYHLPGDEWHLSEEGHRRAADLIFNFIQA